MLWIYCMFTCQQEYCGSISSPPVSLLQSPPPLSSPCSLRSYELAPCCWIFSLRSHGRREEAGDTDGRKGHSSTPNFFTNPFPLKWFFQSKRFKHEGEVCKSKTCVWLITLGHGIAYHTTCNHKLPTPILNEMARIVAHCNTQLSRWRMYLCACVQKHFLALLVQEQHLNIQ